MMIPGLSSVTDFRPIGESRFYTILVRDSAIGQLKSTIKQRTQVAGIRGVIIEQDLQLDYTLIGGERKLSIQGQHFVSDRGFYLGDKKTIIAQGRTETFELARKGDLISGYFTRGGSPVEQSAQVPANSFAFDNNFFDELELLIGMNQLQVGELLELDLVEPQTMLTSRFKAVVEDFQYMPIHKTLADSVFLINVFEPQAMLLYFSKDRRLLKAEIADQKMTVYLDRVTGPPPSSAGQRQIGLRDYLLSIPGYFMNLLLAMAAALFFIGRGYRWKATYLAFFGGALVFVVVPQIQIPLQNFLMVKVFIPGIKTGGSPFVLGIFPSLAAGLIQELLKAGVILGLLRILKLKSYQYLAIGAVCGAGFGFVEGCYLNTMIGSFALVSVVLVERVSYFLFHATSGALMGLSLSDDKGRLPIMVTVTVLFNTLLRYLPLFVQQQKVELALMYMIMAVLVLGLLTWALFQIKGLQSTRD